jgi:putative endopeptidase
MVPKSLKEEYLKYCEELRTVFAQRIKANEWMSEGSKKNALEKLEAMVFNVGYPDKWVEEALPDLSKSKSLIEDIYSFRKSRVNLLKAIIGKTRQEASFTVMLMNGLPLSKENAEYFSFYNAITIFPYYLLPPRHDPAQSLAINYAYLYVFGHEMTHGFDTNGSQYDKNGDYREGGIWASEADKAEFDRRAGLLVKWFGSFDVLPDEMPGVKAEGKVTLPENIADLGGIEIAWQAYLNRLQADGYTGQELKLMKQRFFQAYANEWCAKYGQKHVDYFSFGKERSEGPDPHSLNKERVNGILPNMDDWYDLFGVKPGDKLYLAPADRIHIW